MSFFVSQIPLKKCAPLRGTLFFLLFLIFRQTTLKSMHLLLFVTSVIFGTIPKSLKILMKTCHFFSFFFCLSNPSEKVCTFESNTFFSSFFSFFIVRQTPLKSMHLSPFVPSVIFGTIPKSMKTVPWTPHTLMKMSFFSCFFVRQTPLKKCAPLKEHFFFLFFL